jgi:hypothetical protein
MAERQQGNPFRWKTHGVNPRHDDVGAWPPLRLPQRLDTPNAKLAPCIFFVDATNHLK